MTIPVRETAQGVFERINGNPTLTRLDGGERAPLRTLLHESFSDEKRASFGVFLAEKFVAPQGKRAVGGETFAYIDGVIKQQFDVEDVPPRTLLDGVEFLSRVTDEEYRLITAAAMSNAQIGRWLDIFRLHGEIDVAGSTALTAKAGLVAAGLLSESRANEIFASVPG